MDPDVIHIPRLSISTSFDFAFHRHFDLFRSGIEFLSPNSKHHFDELSHQFQVHPDVTLVDIINHVQEVVVGGLSIEDLNIKFGSLLFLVIWSLKINAKVCGLLFGIEKNWSTNPTTVPACCDHYFHTGCPSVLKLQNQAKITAIRACGLDVWIMDDSCLVKVRFM